MTPQAAGLFWWYAPIAGALVEGLHHAACDHAVRPLLGLRHVTPKRAQILVKRLRLSSVQDVASVFPPTILSDAIPYLGKWRAVEMVLDARMQLRHEASLLEAQAHDRRMSLLRPAAP